MTVVILQPSYWPWRGYFHQIWRADHFVFLDNVQYDKHGWRNRNRIKTPNGLAWFTVPVRHTGRSHQLIRDVEIINGAPWIKKHIKILSQNYSKATHFGRYATEIEHLLDRDWHRLMDLTVETTRWAASALGINTSFHFASDLSSATDPNLRLVEICLRLKASKYVSGPSAQAYLNAEQFLAKGIEVEFMTYDYPAYPQLHGAFAEQASILDLLFNCGPDSPQHIWKPDA